MKFSRVSFLFAISVFAMFIAGPVLAENVKVAMVLPGNISDKSWNQAGYEGLMQIKDELGFDVAYSEKVPQPDQVEAMADYARRGYNYVIGHGGEFQEAAARVARQYPDVMFVVHNGIKPSKNVATVGIDLKQVGIVVGYIAGKMSKTGKGGYICAQKLKKYVELGDTFAAGFRMARSDGKTSIAWTNDWDDIAKGKEAALNQINQGADVIFPTMDNATIGSLQAAKEKGVYAIGMYYDAYSDWPDIILNSAIVNWRQAMVELFSIVKNGKQIEGKDYLWDLNYPKVLNIGTFHPAVPESVRMEAAELLEKVKTGAIKP
ncbi:MAG: BMP family protein [Desulfobacterales bacterium]|nr:MAG: BMP family protein [Desulfobacterales bacterium]